MLKDKANYHFFWLLEEETFPLQYCIHQRVNQAYSPADDVTILVASPISSRRPTPLPPSQLIALLLTCSFSGGPSTLALVAVPPPFSTGTPAGSCGQQSPLHSSKLRSRFLLMSAQGPLRVFEHVANPWFGELGPAEARRLSERVEPSLLQ